LLAADDVFERRYTSKQQGSEVVRGFVVQAEVGIFFHDLQGVTKFRKNFVARSAIQHSPQFYLPERFGDAPGVRIRAASGIIEVGYVL
jgi:hypothetical protein